MILQFKTSFHHKLRATAYAVCPEWLLRRIKRSADGPLIHETATYWNQELSGRMSHPNINGRISNDLRDMTAVVLIRNCMAAAERVLDVGCGFGSLANALASAGLRRYVGVDLSDYVIKRAAAECAEWPVAGQCELSFHQADLREFSPADHDRFNVIAFNEVLKYIEIDEAVAQLRRYQQWLDPDGVFCVNITADPKCRRIFRALNSNFRWIYGTVYQQRPDGPKYRLTRDSATPAYLVGLFSPRDKAA